MNINIWEVLIMKKFLAIGMSMILMISCIACGGSVSKSEASYDAYAGGGNNYSMAYEEA
jgi:hypothetical protein